MFSDLSLDVNTFWDSWSQFKAMIAEINASYNIISSMIDEYSMLAQRARGIGKEDIAIRADQGKDRMTNILISRNRIKLIMDQWLPLWNEVESKSVDKVIPDPLKEKLLGGGISALTGVIDSWNYSYQKLVEEKGIINGLRSTLLTTERTIQLTTMAQSITPAPDVVPSEAGILGGYGIYAIIAGIGLLLFSKGR